VRISQCTLFIGYREHETIHTVNLESAGTGYLEGYLFLLRQQLARELLPRDLYAAHPEGLHAWLSLPFLWDRRELVAHLQAQGGVAVVPSDAFAVGGAERAPDAVRISLGAATNRSTLRHALQLLATSVASERLASFSEVV
jgi:DNA-binding transcriptional MocR family regulator